jgi:hypothetical protein
LDLQQRLGEGGQRQPRLPTTCGLDGVIRLVDKLLTASMVAVTGESAARRGDEVQDQLEEDGAHENNTGSTGS